MTIAIAAMGVPGCDKSTVGQKTAERLGYVFHDGDEFHSEANRTKMHTGISLNGDDCKSRLESIRTYMDKKTSGGQSLVATCSALKQRYHDILRGAADSAEFVYLKGDFDLLRGRLATRRNHFLSSSLLYGQFDTLEESTDAVIIDIALPLETIVDKTVTQPRACAAHCPAT